MPKITWPDNKQFAFTIFDDTDNAQLPDIATTYQFLEDIGLRTTKSVWTVLGAESPLVGGTTCEDTAYREWVLGLQAKGFEIGLHNVAFSTSSRGTTIEGFDRFRSLFGHDPNTLANHTGCKESIYWGRARLSGINRLIYDLVMRITGRKDSYHGHIVGHPLFWGDVCRKRVSYVRNFVFNEINTLKACPWMPYHDSRRPWVRAWFASSEGPVCDSFCKMVNEKSQDQLALEGGACIMYTHFGSGFCMDGRLNGQFRQLMERLSKMNGWFVPTNTLLDHIASIQGVHDLAPAERNRLERSWLLHKMLCGTT